MRCVMPNIYSLTSTLDQKSTMHVSVYFVMDGIEKLRNLDFNFIYVQNPVLYKFEGDEYVKEFDLTETQLEIKVIML